MSKHETPSRQFMPRRHAGLPESGESTLIESSAYHPEYAHGCTEDSGLLAVAGFVTAIEPPQPGLAQVLHHVGLTSYRGLQRLASDSRVQDKFLDTLVRQSKISYFQSVLLEDALRRSFSVHSACSTKM